MEKFDEFYCSSCGKLTSDISPLGPESVIICEDCANNPRIFVQQFIYKDLDKQN